MLTIPELTDPDIAFGNTEHLPKYDSLPEDYRRHWHSASQMYCHAISQWFSGGAKFDDGKLTIDGVTFVPKPGVDAKKALRAIKAVLGSWEPKHEHKIAGCGFMLSEWFEIENKDARRTA